jgi:hypothetical protein
MMPLERGHGIHLVATCLLNAPTSRTSVSEIYEWLAEKYPCYQFTKDKDRKVLLHDSERKSSRFVIANVAWRECRFDGLFGLEQSLNSADRLVALPPLSPNFPSSMVAFLNKFTASFAT